QLQLQRQQQALLDGGDSPPGIVCLPCEGTTTSIVVTSAGPVLVHSPPTPAATPSAASPAPSTSTTTASSPSSTKGDSDHIKDSIRSVEELMKAPQQAHSAIQQIHKGQKMSGMDREAFVRARKIKSPCSAFAEVAEIKMIVYQLLLAPPTGPHISDLGNHNNGESPPSHNNNNALNGTTNGTSSRKRSANFGQGGSSQPEHPVALRPANCVSNGAFLPTASWGPNGWHNLFALRTSPTLPGAAPTTDAASAAGEMKQWSSPSSVESAHCKADSNAGDSNIDPVGMESDGSPTSSTCTQSPADVLAFAAAAVQNSSMASHSNGHQERKPRKQISDDYVKLIRQAHDNSGKKIEDIQIPVPEALECDPTFTAVSEQQIVQQVVQTKKFEEMSPKDVQEATTQLCKKLAEKRVFGPRLMAQTTVAGPNHSTYNNLPDNGILYIQHVCRTVLGDKLKTDDEFWDVFREAMRKLAARCRRVRHAKKTKSLKENGTTPLLETNALSLLGHNNLDWVEAFKKNAINFTSSSSGSGGSPPQDIFAQLAQGLPPVIKSESPEMNPLSLLNSNENDWADKVRLRALSAASPNLPMHSELSAQIASSLPSFDDYEEKFEEK
ncbi:hypothetical protein PFISCL1PPCAC_27567, partial [Pristionchus fissidentatus]